jgi:hypothetical protein
MIDGTALIGQFHRFMWTNGALVMSSPFNRRRFLQAGGVVAGGAVLGGLVGSRADAASIYYK